MLCKGTCKCKRQIRSPAFYIRHNGRCGLVDNDKGLQILKENLILCFHYSTMFSLFLCAFKNFRKFLRNGFVYSKAQGGVDSQTKGPRTMW